MKQSVACCSQTGNDAQIFPLFGRTRFFWTKSFGGSNWNLQQIVACFRSIIWFAGRSTNNAHSAAGTDTLNGNPTNRLISIEMELSWSNGVPRSTPISSSLWITKRLFCWNIRAICQTKWFWNGWIKNLVHTASKSSVCVFFSVPSREPSDF